MAADHSVGGDDCSPERRRSRGGRVSCSHVFGALAQDIPKTSDRAPSRTFYTWHVDWPLTARRLAAELYQVAGNVWMRMQHEQAQVQEVRQAGPPRAVLGGTAALMRALAAGAPSRPTRGRRP